MWEVLLKANNHILANGAKQSLHFTSSSAMSSTPQKESWNVTSLVAFYHKIQTNATLIVKNPPTLLVVLTFYCSKGILYMRAKVHPRTELSLNAEMLHLFVWKTLLMRELTEEKGLSRDKYLASYTHLSYFLLEVFPKLKNKKEHLFWRWATHFFLTATQNIMNNLEKDCQTYQLPCL